MAHTDVKDNVTEIFYRYYEITMSILESILIKLPRVQFDWVCIDNE